MDSTSWRKDCQRICGHFKTFTGTYGQWQEGIMNRLTEVFSLVIVFILTYNIACLLNFSMIIMYFYKEKNIFFLKG